MTAPQSSSSYRAPLWQEIAGGIICLVAVGGYFASNPSWAAAGVLLFCVVLS